MNQQEWEEHYRTAAHSEPQPPDRLLTDNHTLLTGGTALDIATGSGRNAFFLAECGYQVIAVDRAESAARLVNQKARSRGLSVEAAAADMLDINLGTERFDLITNFYFLERELIPRIKQSLKPAGLVFFETFTSYQIPRDDPRYRKFLIDPNELLTLFSNFFIMYYFERLKGGKAVASMIAKKV
jgi:2-polyprenyl-3-methyl-5-hydroxy-6-metoxy-1,4-benzoquinol methylase